VSAGNIRLPERWIIQEIGIIQIKPPLGSGLTRALEMHNYDFAEWPGSAAFSDD
jgi:hypothetical protein